MCTMIVAEVASNHGGDIKLAKEFIRVAAEVGVDYVKFQSWQASKLRDGRNDPQYEWFSKAELSDAVHWELMEECSKRGVRFLTTLFDEERIDFLTSLGLTEIKIASPDANNFALLGRAKQSFKHLIVSTGLSTCNEILETAHFLKDAESTLCHSVSLYPVSLQRANLSRIDWLRTIATKVGYSDHTEGIEAANIAIAKGVHYLEKHFCLGRNGPGRVCSWDATPNEMRALVDYRAVVEKATKPPAAEIPDDLRRARDFFVGRFRVGSSTTI